MSKVAPDGTARCLIDLRAYQHAVPWPIYDKQEGRTIMFFMIHATDHPAATGLMDRAYHKAVISERDFRQVLLAFTDR